MTSTNPVADAIADLQGTCQSLEAVLERHGLTDTKDVCEAIDQGVFCCDQCDWWCERCEESLEHGGVCTDCQPDEEED